MFALNYNHDDEDLQKFHFENGKIINENELIILELMEMLLGDNYRYCPQIPLGVICSRPENTPYLPCDFFKFWANSKVDIAVMERGYRASRQAKLVIECQSQWHDLLEVQVRDRKKAKLLNLVGIPLIYVRRVEDDQRFYRFYTPDSDQEVFYNLITQSGRSELETFLRTFL